MKLETHRKAWRKAAGFLFKCCAALCFATLVSYGSPVVYTFTGTAPAKPGSPSHSEVFQLTVPDFLQVTLNGPALQMMSTDPVVKICSPCNNPPVPALVFLRSSGSDMIQFLDLNGTNYAYFFPQNALSEIGSFKTLPGINVNAGTLQVAGVPEPSTMSFVIVGLGAVLLGLRPYRTSPVADEQQGGHIQ